MDSLQRAGLRATVRQSRKRTPVHLASLRNEIHRGSREEFPRDENPVFQTDERMPLPRICPVEFSHQPPAPAPPTSPPSNARQGRDRPPFFQHDFRSRRRVSDITKAKSQEPATILWGCFQGKRFLNVCLSPAPPSRRVPMPVLPACRNAFATGWASPPCKTTELLSQTQFRYRGAFLANAEKLETAEGR